MEKYNIPKAYKIASEKNAIAPLLAVPLVVAGGAYLGKQISDEDSPLRKGVARIGGNISRAFGNALPKSQYPISGNIPKPSVKASPVAKATRSNQGVPSLGSLSDSILHQESRGKLTTGAHKRTGKGNYAWGPYGIVTNFWHKQLADSGFDLAEIDDSEYVSQYDQGVSPIEGHKQWIITTPKEKWTKEMWDSAMDKVTNADRIDFKNEFKREPNDKELAAMHYGGIGGVRDYLSGGGNYIVTDNAKNEYPSIRGYVDQVTRRMEKGGSISDLTFDFISDRAFNDELNKNHI